MDIATSSSYAASVASAQLVQLINGEYTTASVAGDEQAVAKLDLVKTKDGNYAAPPTAEAIQSLSSSTLAAINDLQIGGP